MQSSSYVPCLGRTVNWAWLLLEMCCALNSLLELSASSGDQSEMNGHNTIINDGPFLASSDNFTDTSFDSTSYSSESDLLDNVWCVRHPSRNQSQFVVRKERHSSTGNENLDEELSQKVLESLFSMPTPKSAEREPYSMNWRKIVMKMASLGHKPEVYPGNGDAEHRVHAKGDEYQVFREAANQQWESVRSCYQKAAAAFTNGERQYAAYLAEQGRSQNRIAREADKKASQDIFEARNKSIENLVTIDLHGQHVKQAMKLLKLHLVFGAYVRSIRSFRVITGCGSHGVGKSKLKKSVIDLLEREGIAWSEENRGTLLIRLDEQTNFSFVDSDSDNE